jgi:hypothetical protein
MNYLKLANIIEVFYRLVKFRLNSFGALFLRLRVCASYADNWLYEVSAAQM